MKPIQSEDGLIGAIRSVTGYLIPVAFYNQSDRGELR